MALQALTYLAEREGSGFSWQRRQYDIAAIPTCRCRSSHVGGTFGAGRPRPETAVPELGRGGCGRSVPRALRPMVRGKAVAEMISVRSGVMYLKKGALRVRKG